jgi:hypothetical protein
LRKKGKPEKPGKILGIYRISFVRGANWKNKTQETYESVSNIDGLADDEFVFLAKKLAAYTNPRVKELKQIIHDANEELNKLTK